MNKLTVEIDLDFAVFTNNNANLCNVFMDIHKKIADMQSPAPYITGVQTFPIVAAGILVGSWKMENDPIIGFPPE